MRDAGSEETVNEALIRMLAGYGVPEDPTEACRPNSFHL
jgi:hypothetical protein